MSKLVPLQLVPRLLAFHCAVLVCHSQAQEFEAIYSKVSRDYVRTRLPDGTYLPETYTLKEGDYWGGFIVDGTIDTKSFGDVIPAIESALAGRRYVPSRNPKTTKLSIVVDWGTASPPSAMPQPETAYLDQLVKSNQSFAKEVKDLTANAQGNGPGQRPSSGETALSLEASVEARFAAQVKDSERAVDQMTNSRNAGMMGYPSAADSDLQQFRYFIVLRAYDSQRFARSGKSPLLWEARFSISMGKNAFGEQLAAMLQVASKYFGRNSGGLRRELEPRGHVEIGDLRYVGFVPDPNRAALAPDGAHVAYLRTAKSGLRLEIVDIDTPGRPASVDISTLALQPIRLAWADAGHVLVEVTSTDSLCFSADGKSAKLDEDNPGQHGSGKSRDAGPEAQPSPLQALAEEKLPHRKVTLLGSDDAGRRLLLVASGGGGPDRFFVLDRPNDLLYEVDRSDPSP